jgi:hypothetical protein
MIFYFLFELGFALLNQRFIHLELFKLFLVKSTLLIFFQGQKRPFSGKLSF